MATLEEFAVNSDRRWNEHLRAEDRVHATLTDLVAKLDDRADRADVRNARVMGAVGVILAVGQWVAPPVLRALGLLT